MEQGKFSAATIVRQLVLFGVLGFAIVMLAGPVLALLSIVIPFAVVGFLAWGLFALVFQGKRLDWRALGATVRQIGSVGWRLLAAPLRAFSGVLGGLLIVVWFLWRKFWATVWFAVEIALLTAVGVGVGALVGFINRAQQPSVEVAVVGNAILGGALAAVAGIIMTAWEKRGAVRRTNPTAPV